MNRSVILSSFCSILLGAAMFAQAGSSRRFSDPQMADLIAKVKAMPVSELDKKLPALGVEAWLQEQAGPGTTIGWLFRDLSAGIRDLHEYPACVEADATLKDGRTFFVLIDVSTDAAHPRVHDANVIVNKKDMTEVPRLSDLPRVLSETSQNPHRLEAQK